MGVKNHNKKERIIIKGGDIMLDWIKAILFIIGIVLLGIVLYFVMSIIGVILNMSLGVIKVVAVLLLLYIILKIN